MVPYFTTNHLAGGLLAVATLGWGTMELSSASQSSRPREGVTRIGGIRARLGIGVVLLACVAAVYAAPHIFPEATIRPEVAAFAAGLVILVTGVVLRGWSIKTLGQYFTRTVMVSADQPVVTAGPYRLLRHPSYTGLLMAYIGLGLASANWAGLVAVTLLVLAMLRWRIHVEETALLAVLGDQYRSYAAHRKRLVPLVW